MGSTWNRWYPNRRCLLEELFYRESNDIVLSLEDVSLSYAVDKENNAVISEFNLSVHKGEFLVLVGPSGCGKTTLLSLMAGILRPTTGEVRMHGEVIDGPNTTREIIFQRPTLYPWYDVFDNVAYGLKMKKVRKEIIDAKVREYLEMMDMSDYIHSKIYELSGGQKQRVSLARALINNPEIVLMDEPFSALDAFTRKNMQIYVRELWRKKGWTFVLITHDVDEALEVASRIIVLSKDACKIKGQYNAMFSVPLSGGSEDDKVRTSDEYIGIKRSILNDIKSEIMFKNYVQ